MKNLLNRHNFDLRTLATVSIAIVSWASAFAGIRAAPGAYSPGHIALLRYGTASVALAVYAAITRNLHLLNTHYSLLVSYTTFTLPLCIWMLKGFFDGIYFTSVSKAREVSLPKISTTFTRTR